MKYSCFRAFKGGRILLFVFLFLAGFLLYQNIKPEPASSRRIKRDVAVAGRTVGGMTAEEAEVVINELAGAMHIPPVDAFVDTATGGVVADLNGLAIAVEETLQKLLVAEEGEEVTPAFRQIPAKVTLSDLPLHPIYRGNPEKRQVVFLINVAWGNEYLKGLLDVLQEEKSQATFFLTGRWVNGNPKEARLISEAGFEIASHGYSDALSMGQAEMAVIEEDMDKSIKVIKEVCGVDSLYISTHKGELSPSVLQAAADRKLRVIMWTLDTVDWRLPGVQAMLDKIIPAADNGNLILMHPTSQTAAFLRQAIPALREKGLEPVNLSQLLNPVRNIGSDTPW